MFRLLPVLSAIPLLLAFGVAEGLWTDRWSLSPHLAQAPERLAQLPPVVGPWHGEDQELDPRQVRQADLRAYLLRRYVHRASGEALTVLLVCGRPGPVAVHSPEVCYRGAGFAPSAPRARHAVQAEGLSGPAELWAQRYHKPGAAVPEYLQLYYGWNPSGGRSAADRPRLTFASARALYKLYVLRYLSRPDEPAELDPIPGFLRLFLPQADRCLFSTP
jgi:hypothetical protein